MGKKKMDCTEIINQTLIKNNKYITDNQNNNNNNKNEFNCNMEILQIGKNKQQQHEHQQQQKTDKEETMHIVLLSTWTENICYIQAFLQQKQNDERIEQE